MATRDKSQSQRTIEKAGPTKPMSDGQPGKAPREGVQDTAEVIDHLERPDHVPPPAANSDQG